MKVSSNKYILLKKIRNSIYKIQNSKISTSICEKSLFFLKKLSKNISKKINNTFFIEIFYFNFNDFLLKRISNNSDLKFCTFLDLKGF